MRRAICISFQLLLFLLFSNYVYSQRCEEYTGKVCKGYVDYPIFIEAAGLPQEVVESVIVSNSFENLTTMAMSVHPVCANAAVEYFCQTYFPRCVQEVNSNVTRGMSPCLTVCENYRDQCSLLLQSFKQADKIPDCRLTRLGQPYPTEDCSINVLSLVETEGFVCPSPLVKKIDGTNMNNTQGVRCFGKCCIPCPYVHYLYKEGRMDFANHVVNTISIISFFFALFIIITYILCKEKRGFPAILVTLVGVSLMTFYFSGFLALGGSQKLKCLSPVEQASPGYNTNSLCKAQSVFVVFGALASAFWYFSIVLNIHLVVFWSIRNTEKYFKAMNAVFWGLPLLFVIIYQSAGKSGYDYGISCTLERGPYMNGVVMIPLAIIIFSSFLINFATLVKIFIVARDKNAKLNHIISLQIRPFAFAFIVMVLFMIYWIYFEVVSSEDREGDWMSSWLYCILTGNGQNECSKYSEPFLPRISAFTFSESVVHSFGIILLIFFGIREEVLRFWLNLITGKELTSFSFSFLSTFSSERRESTHSNLDTERKVEMSEKKVEMGESKEDLQDSSK